MSLENIRSSNNASLCNYSSVSGVSAVAHIINEGKSGGDKVVDLVLDKDFPTLSILKTRAANIKEIKSKIAESFSPGGVHAERLKESLIKLYNEASSELPYLIDSLKNGDGIGKSNDGEDKEVENNGADGNSKPVVYSSTPPPGSGGGDGGDDSDLVPLVSSSDYSLYTSDTKLSYMAVLVYILQVILPTMYEAMNQTQENEMAVTKNRCETSLVISASVFTLAIQSRDKVKAAAKTEIALAISGGCAAIIGGTMGIVSSLKQVSNPKTVHDRDKMALNKFNDANSRYEKLRNKLHIMDKDKLSKGTDYRIDQTVVEMKGYGPQMEQVTREYNQAAEDFDTGRSTFDQFISRKAQINSRQVINNQPILNKAENSYITRHTDVIHARINEVARVEETLPRMNAAWIDNTPPGMTNKDVEDMLGNLDGKLMSYDERTGVTTFLNKMPSHDPGGFSYEIWTLTPSRRGNTCEAKFWGDIDFTEMDDNTRLRITNAYDRLIRGDSTQALTDMQATHAVCNLKSMEQIREHAYNNPSSHFKYIVGKDTTNQSRMDNALTNGNLLFARADAEQETFKILMDKQNEWEGNGGGMMGGGGGKLNPIIELASNKINAKLQVLHTLGNLISNLSQPLNSVGNTQSNIANAYSAVINALKDIAQTQGNNDRQIYDQLISSFESVVSNLLSVTQQLLSGVGQAVEASMNKG